jgi:hypothetical protein
MTSLAMASGAIGSKNFCTALDVSRGAGRAERQRQRYRDGGPEESWLQKRKRHSLAVGRNGGWGLDPAEVRGEVSRPGRARQAENLAVRLCY